MPDYGNCYNSTGSRCSGGPQPGTVALWKAVVALFPILGTLGIYNCRPSSGGGGLSTHGEGRGWDCRCNAFDPAQKAAGDRLATLLIKYHKQLGVQRIIWNRKQTDVRSGMGTWRAYGGASPHTDHLHIELCWSSARDNPLTETYVKQVLSEGEDDLPYTEAQLRGFIRDEVRAVLDEAPTAITEKKGWRYSVWKALYKLKPGSSPAEYEEHLNVIEKKIDAP